MTTIPEGLRTDAPPENPRQQILAWGIDQHGLGFNKEGQRPRWMIVQWHRAAFYGGPYWLWSVPGRATSVRILGWLPLPALDSAGEAMAMITERAMSDEAVLQQAGPA